MTLLSAPKGGISPFYLGPLTSQPRPSSASFRASACLSSSTWRFLSVSTSEQDVKACPSPQQARLSDEVPHWSKRLSISVHDVRRGPLSTDTSKKPTSTLPSIRKVRHSGWAVRDAADGWSTVHYTGKQGNIPSRPEFTQLRGSPHPGVNNLKAVRTFGYRRPLAFPRVSESSPGFEPNSASPNICSPSGGTKDAQTQFGYVLPLTRPRPSELSKASEYDGAIVRNKRVTRTPDPNPKARYLRWKRSLRQPPSALLVNALKSTGHSHAVPLEPPTKVDHSFLSPRQYASTKHDGGNIFSTEFRTKKAAHSTEVSLQSILASYIKEFHRKDTRETLPVYDGPRDDIIRLVFTQSTVDHLAGKGYAAQDIVTWAWIITARTSENAARRLLAMCNKPGEVDSHKVPTFVVLFLLRRQEISAAALRLLTVHVSDRLNRRHNPRYELSIQSEEDAAKSSMPHFANSQNATNSGTVWSRYASIDHQARIIMIIRLIRHARKRWSSGLPTISSMFTKHVGGPPSIEERLKPDVVVHLTFTYNKMLALLALPSTASPYLSIPYHQRAQFKILRRMTEFEPALLVNREGYGAVTSVQLAHKKSLPEREWALMKANTWPPWKHEKLGLDANVGVEHGVSRARQTLYRLHESGYESREWEKSVTVLSGWDTDNSPTIQKRILVDRPPVQSHATFESHNGGIWTARILATRTLDEAWACFLAYKESGTAPFSEIYFAMTSKIIYNNIRNSRETNLKVPSDHQVRVSSSLPGDGVEISPSPNDPRERIYVPTPPPSLDTFYASTLVDGVRPAGRFLTFLLRHASDYQHCASYLRNSTLPRELVAMLLGEVALDRETLIKMPQQHFAAIVDRFSQSHSTISSETYWSAITHSSTAFKSPEARALRLVFVCKPCYRPPWYTLLSNLTRQQSTKPENEAHTLAPAPQTIANWKIVLRILQEMRSIDLDLDARGLQIVCQCFSRAAQSGHGLLDNIRSRPRGEAGLQTWPRFKGLGITDCNNNLEALQLELETVIATGLKVLKNLFRKLVSTGFEPETVTQVEHDNIQHVLNDGKQFDSESFLPRVLEIPGPAHLHSFIRALGFARDYGGLRDLVTWMARFAPEIQSVMDEQQNGKQQLRRCIRAIRVFLEGEWNSDVGSGKRVLEDGVNKAPEALIQEVFNTIEDVEQWGGWASEEEAEEYCTTLRKWQ